MLIVPLNLKGQIDEPIKISGDIIGFALLADEESETLKITHLDNAEKINEIEKRIAELK